MIILTDNIFFRIDLLYENLIARLTWLKQPDDLLFQKAFVAFLEIAKKYKVKNLLSDNRIGISINVAMQRWTAEVGASYLPNLQVQRYARVVTQDAFQQLVTYKMYDSFNTKAINNLDLRLFTEIEEGTDWILSESAAINSNTA